MLRASESLPILSQPAPQVREWRGCPLVPTLPIHADPSKRLRRVKCDEGKPACARCLKFGIRCEGYRDPYLAGEEKATGRHQFKVLSFTHRDETILSPLSAVVVFSSPFHDPGLNRYFLFFQEHTIPELYGTFDEGLFSHIALQACYTEPALMCIVAAIGAVDKSFQSQYIDRNASEASMHRHQALLSYGQALTGIQRLASTPTAHTPRIILLAALLIFCFQNILGDVSAARGQITSAIHLLQRQLAKKATTYRHTRSSTNTDFEHILVAAFARLDNGIISQPDLLLEGPTKKKKTTPKRQGGILEIDFAPGDALPFEFEHILEARNYLEVLQFHSIPLLVQEFPGISSNQAFAPRQHPGDTTAYDTAIRIFHEWNAVFLPLHTKCTVPTPTGAQNPQYIGAETMRARGMATLIAFQSLFPTNILHYPRTQPNSCNLAPAPPDISSSCREVLRLSKMLAAQPGFRRGFVLDCGIVPAVFIAMVAPVELSIKREALKVMKELVPRREVTWDSAELVKVGEIHLKACTRELSLCS